MKKQKTYGWGRKDFSDSFFYKTKNIEEIYEIFELAKKRKFTISLRSGGNSYGDNSLNSENIIIQNTNDNILDFDDVEGTISVEGGITLEKIINYTVPKKWMLHVSPAKKNITIAGCLANNVHGKNCYKKGYFGEYVEEFELFSYEKGVIKCSRKTNKNIFYSVISGLGIMGIILSAKIKLRKLKSFYLINKINKSKNISEIINYMNNNYNYEFNIASCDTTKYSNFDLPGISYSSDFLTDENFDIAEKNKYNFINIFDYIYPKIKKLPFAETLLNYSFSIQSRGKFIKNHSKNISFKEMNFLSDKFIPNYNLYFKKGFIEYQVIFDYKYCEKAFLELRKSLHKNETSSLMCAVKRYRESKESFIFGLNKNGYCISFDICFENEKKMNKIIRDLNQITLKYNGQLYLGKTPCINHEEFREMYKNTDKFLRIKRDLDPENIIISDMSKRLKLY